MVLDVSELGWKTMLNFSIAFNRMILLSLKHPAQMLVATLLIFSLKKRLLLWLPLP